MKKMNKSWKSKWIKALTSGKYQQARGALRRERNGEFGYCCLGVLANQANGRKWSNNGTCSLGEGSLNDVGLNKFGLSYEAQAKLINMNDHEGYSFTDIAAWIKKNL